MNKPLILIVDDEPNNLKLLNQILQNNYQIRAATNGRDALKRVNIEPKPSLVLLDIMMPEMDGYQVCQKLKSDPRTVGIPVIFVTAMSEIEDETKGFEAGAVDYITKPVSAPIVLARVATHVALADQQRICEQTVHQRTEALETSRKSAIHMLGEAGHYNDTDTGEHIWRMAAYARMIAQTIGWPVNKAKMMELAAPMHDTGKIGTPDSILKAPRKLTPDEWEIMKKHTVIGHSILSKADAPIFQMAAEIALSHHEKWDGKGYPHALAGKAIPESARIVAIADVFDALTMRRPYKEAWPVEKALETIRKDAGTHFDPTIANIFFSIQDSIMQIKQDWDSKELAASVI